MCTITTTSTNRATVLSAVGVMINSAYLHQASCTGDDTVWGLKATFVHLDGVAESAGGNRRSLKDANVTMITSYSTHTVDTGSKNATAAKRRLAETEAPVSLAGNTSTVVVGADTQVSACPDEMGLVRGLFSRACLCLDKENPKSAQCAIEFYREAANGNGTDDGDEDEDDESEDSGVAGLWLGLLALICMLCFVMRTQKREEESIDELRRGLVATRGGGYRM